MSEVIHSGKKPTKPLFGMSRGAIIPLSRKLGLPLNPQSQPKKQTPAADKESPGSKTDQSS